MQGVTDSRKSPSVAGANVAEVFAVSQSAYPEFRIVRRNGAAVGLGQSKIPVAMIKAFAAIEAAAPGLHRIEKERSSFENRMVEHRTGAQARSVGMRKPYSAGVQRRQSWAS